MKFPRFAVSSTRIIEIVQEPRTNGSWLPKRGRLFLRDSIVRTSRTTRSVRNCRTIRFGDTEEGDREWTRDRTVQVLRLKSRSVYGRSYLNFTCFCFHPVSYSVFLELSQTTVGPIGELFPVRAGLSDRMLGRGSRGTSGLQGDKE